jgi:anti-sigma regulatory factor (Ser/Thr protein kinase)
MLEVRHRFPAHPASASAARRAIDSLLAASSPRELADARIVVSELVTNVIIESRGPDRGWIELTLRLSRDALRIEVRRTGPEPDRAPVRTWGQGALSGDSLSLVESLTEDWGRSPDAGLWAVLAWSRGYAVPVAH